MYNIIHKYLSYLKHTSMSLSYHPSTAQRFNPVRGRRGPDQRARKGSSNLIPDEPIKEEKRSKESATTQGNEI
jgi:hypothetical protein